jgi:hypothetical protein
MGYGKNKIEQIHHLRWAGFNFYVLPQSFLIHAPHLKSEAKKLWTKSGNAKQMRWVDAYDFFSRGNGGLTQNDFIHFFFVSSKYTLNPDDQKLQQPPL